MEESLMCGIAGVYWRETPPDTASVLLTALSMQMDGRGGHSYGYFADGNVNRGLGKFHENVSPRDLVGIKSFFMHARFATVGSKTVENSHPFLCGKFLGAHNGAVYNHDELNKKYDRKFEVDSPHIFAHLAENKDLKELEGYGAIELVDTENKLFEPMIAKLSYSGDLEVAQIYAEKECKHCIGVVWASTYGALRSSISAAGFRFVENRNLRAERMHYVDSTNREDELMFIDDKWSTEIGGGYRRSKVITSSQSSFTPGVLVGATGSPTTVTETKDKAPYTVKPEKRYRLYGNGWLDESDGSWHDGWPPKDGTIVMVGGTGPEPKKQKSKKHNNLPKETGRANWKWVNGFCGMCGIVKLVHYEPDLQDVLCGWCLDDLEEAGDAGLDKKRIVLARRTQRAIVAQQIAVHNAEGGGLE